jgi:hypothetical protein
LVGNGDAPNSVSTLSTRNRASGWPVGKPLNTLPDPHQLLRMNVNWGQSNELMRKPPVKMKGDRAIGKTRRCRNKP